MSPFESSQPSPASPAFVGDCTPKREHNCTAMLMYPATPNPFDTDVQTLENILKDLCETFTVTFNRADDVELGLITSSEKCTKGLIILEICPGGTVESWNRSRMDNETMPILKSDRIIEVNGQKEATRMLNECRSESLLKLTIRRPTERGTTNFQPRTISKGNPNFKAGGNTLKRVFARTE